LILLGTIINVVTVTIGSLIGIKINKSIPKRVIETSFQTVGVFTFFLGFKIATEGRDIIIIVLSVVFGTIIGEYIDIEEKFNTTINKIKERFNIEHDKLATGITTSFMLFCIGSMTILGTLEEAIGKGSNILITKAILDGFASIALSSSLGIGVTLSTIPLFLFQGGLTLFFSLFGSSINHNLLSDITGVGGLLIIGLGISLIGLKNIRVLNMTPSLLLIIIFFYISDIIKIIGGKVFY